MLQQIQSTAERKDWPVAPPKFYMEPKNDGFQSRNLLFKGAIFRFHVKISEGYQCLHMKDTQTSQGFLRKKQHVPVGQGENRGAEFGSTFTYPNHQWKKL